MLIVENYSCYSKIRGYNCVRWKLRSRRDLKVFQQV
jgi:hypothetical protein